MDPRFSDDAVDRGMLRERAFALRWATLPEDVIPLTAADPDFPVAVEIREEIKRWIDGGYFSYGPAEGLPEFREAAAHVLRTRKGVDAGPHQVLATNSAAAALEIAARFMLAPGDQAIILDPVDFLFKRSVEAVGGQVIHWPCSPATGEVDFDLLSRIVTPRARMIGLCNPLNPIGKVWTRPELERLADFAISRDLWILSDEVWSDIVFEPARHVSIAALGPEVAARTVTVMSLSKSFGLAGCRIGLLHAASDAAVEGLLEVSGARTTANGAATLSQVAAIAAWRHGWGWLAGFLAHLREMRDWTVERLRAIPGVECRPPDGCYVAFADIRGTGFTAERAAEVLLQRDRVAVVPGSPLWFGPGATGHLRLCFATSRAVLDSALERIEAGFRRGFG